MSNRILVLVHLVSGYKTNDEVRIGIYIKDNITACNEKNSLGCYKKISKHFLGLNGHVVVLPSQKFKGPSLTVKYCFFHNKKQNIVKQKHDSPFSPIWVT